MKFLLNSIIILFPFFGFSQDSFSKLIDYGSEKLHGISFSRSDLGEITIADRHDLFHDDQFDPHINLLNFSSLGEFESGISISFDNQQGFKPTSRWDISSKGDYRLVPFSNLSLNPGEEAGVFCINIKSGDAWCRKTSKVTLGRPSTAFPTSNNKVIAATRPYSDEDVGFENINGYTGLAEFNLDSGEPGWSYTYHEGDISNPYGFFVQDIKELSDGNLIIFANKRNNDTDDYTPGIIKLSPQGEILNNKFLSSLRYSQVQRYWAYQYQTLTIDSDDNIYISGKVDVEPDWNTNNREEGFIAKFNADFELIWSKRVSAEKFEIRGIPIRVSEDGELSFAYFTDGNFPLIAGKLNADGNLLWEHGYNYYSPLIEVDEKGALYILGNGRLLTDGSFVKDAILAKTNISGEIKDCPRFDGCISIIDLDLPSTSFNWVRQNSDTLAEITFKIRSFPATVSDYCATMPKPTPFFYLPDTICEQECFVPDSLSNALANDIEWTITDPFGEKVKIEEESFNYCFNKAGTYNIEQKIWVLGCSDIFSRKIEVLEKDFNLSLGKDSIPCKEESICLTPTSERTLKTFEWSTGDTSRILETSFSGTFGLTASDGFCSQSTSVHITFIEDIINGSAFELPNDTLICIDEFPYLLRPNSEFTNQFFLENTSPDSLLIINNPGTYEVKTLIEGCEFKKAIRIDSDDCKPDIYIPNVFSPNNDGINDTFIPLGNEIEPIRLQIYNRWGGKIFESSDANSGWNGTFNNKPADQGIYLFQFEYFNLLKGEKELVSGDILLLRN